VPATFIIGPTVPAGLPHCVSECRSCVSLARVQASVPLQIWHRIAVPVQGPAELDQVTGALASAELHERGRPSGRARHACGEPSALGYICWVCSRC